MKNLKTFSQDNLCEKCSPTAAASWGPLRPAGDVVLGDFEDLLLVVDAFRGAVAERRAKPSFTLPFRGKVYLPPRPGQAKRFPRNGPAREAVPPPQKNNTRRHDMTDGIVGR